MPPETYTRKVTRANPTCFLFLIDQSGSMKDTFNDEHSKASFVTNVLNKSLYTFSALCSNDEGAINDYFDIGVITYSGDGIANGLAGELSRNLLNPISQIIANPLRLKDTGIRRAKLPIWLEPKHNGTTPMRQALREAAKCLHGWCSNHLDSYPPTVIHITDGESSDGDPLEPAEMIRGLGTEDGECLLFNLHVSSSRDTEPLLFPSHGDDLSDPYSRLLYKMSSRVPRHLIAIANDRNYKLDGDARFFMYNADRPELVLDFIDIGTVAKLGSAGR